MVKISILADSQKNNSMFVASISATQKNRGISARKPLDSTTEKNGRNGAPCSAGTKRLGRVARIVAL